jgi:hypothetical protein
VQVDDRRERILYLEGEPRWEMKFIKEAAARDPNLSLVVLQRTAPDKFYRFGVEHAEELVGGVPATREELFGYRGIVLGSFEASAFSLEQQRLLASFVDVRGGDCWPLAAVTRSAKAAGRARRSRARCRSSSRRPPEARRPSSSTS